MKEFRWYVQPFWCNTRVWRTDGRNWRGDFSSIYAVVRKNADRPTEVILHKKPWNPLVGLWRCPREEEGRRMNWTAWTGWNLRMTLKSWWQHHCPRIIITLPPIDRGRGIVFDRFLCFFITKIMRKRLDRSAWNFYQRISIASYANCWYSQRRNVRLSVRLSVAFRYCIKTKKASVMISSPSECQNILVSRNIWFITKFDRGHPKRGRFLRLGWVRTGDVGDFSTNKPPYPRNSAR